MPKVFSKSARGSLDYIIDWADWLSGDTIATSTWAEDTGITINSDSFSPTTATVWVSGGVVGSNYKLTNTITTNSVPPRVKTDCITIYIKSGC